jgi:hypothetical protein
LLLIVSNKLDLNQETRFTIGYISNKALTKPKSITRDDNFSSGNLLRQQKGGKASTHRSALYFGVVYSHRQVGHMVTNAAGLKTFSF